MVADLQEKGLFGLQNKPVTTDYHASGDTLREEEPEAIIEAMYDLGELSEAERKLLSVFAVLPAENIPFENLESLMPDEAELEDTLLSLSKKGWLDFNEEDGDFKVSPVVQEIVQLKNDKLWEDVSPIIDIINEKLETEGGIGHFINCTYDEAIIFAHYGEQITLSIKTTEYNLAILFSRLGSYHTTLGNLQQALTFFQERSRLGKAAL